MWVCSLRHPVIQQASIKFAFFLYKPEDKRIGISLQQVLGTALSDKEKNDALLAVILTSWCVWSILSIFYDSVNTRLTCFQDQIQHISYFLIFSQLKTCINNSLSLRARLLLVIIGVTVHLININCHLRCSSNWPLHNPHTEYCERVWILT